MNGNVVEAQEETNNLLLTKVGDILNTVKESYVPYVYSQALGIAGIAEAKKKAKVTDKEDDGEGMDPVGKGDSDVDNDGDSDSSDDYIKNRRKAIGKAIDKDDEDEDDEDDEVDEGKVPPQFLKKNGKNGNGNGNGKNGNGENGNGDEDENGNGKKGKLPPWLKKNNGKNGNGNGKGNGNGDKDDEDVDENLALAPKGIGRKSAKNLYKEFYSEGGDARQSHIYGIERDKYIKMTDEQKDQVKSKYYKERETAERERV